MKRKYGIILLIILLIILIIMTFIFKRNNNDNLKADNNSTTKNVETTNLATEPLTNEEALSILNIYAEPGFELMITEEKNPILTVERKNITTNEVDMIFKVDLNTGIFTIEKIIPKNNSGGGGGA